MILTDATIIVSFLRTPTSNVEKILTSGEAAICGVTRAEILYGAKSEKNLKDLIRILDEFVHVPVDEEIWDELGINLQKLRTRGITAPFQDVLIATVAIKNGLELWSYDKHFSLIQKFLPQLRLFSEE